MDEYWVRRKKKINAKYNVRPFIEASPEVRGKYKLIDLPAIDLSLYKEGAEGLESRQNLALKLEESLKEHGFFKLVGHGIEKEVFDNLKSIGQSIFELPEEEKINFMANSQCIEEEGNRELGIVRGAGFKPKGYWTYANETRDNVEFFNVRHFLHDDIFFNKLSYPELVRNNLNDISNYFRYLHFKILKKVLSLLDIILELTEGTLWNKYFKVVDNDIDNSGGGFGRFLLYHEVNKDYKRSTNNTWMRGHTDATALTFIVCQPILSLQIRDYKTQEWKFVSFTPDSLVVNVGDAFQQLTGGYFKSSIHRVVTSPDEQSHYKRNTIIYFCDPSRNTYIDPEELNSPKLNQLKIKASLDRRITFGEWDDAKGKFFNKKSNTQSQPLRILGRESIGSLMNDTSQNPCLC